eukprot:gnl/TRDRNA2_/TRDRNA2_184954_c0_seq1.p3 gnl/TRDRNA2_/TRDRNA2_184954_c0~~gnl/TRDRNA2_/TRDRNA2_184954_c0_seq1.p3  ORF type:complete len:107 (+),score=16.49 gnl/TRDRNA2_/TRDRNA2_184954_c0_seq1:69-389(+)
MAAALIQSRAVVGRMMARSTMSRAYGTTLSIPNVPEGTGAVFHSRMTPTKYSLSNPKWFILFFASNLGVYFGHYFYINFLMSKNPPNPPRNPDEERPEKHMHTVEE